MKETIKDLDERIKHRKEHRQGRIMSYCVLKKKSRTFHVFLILVFIQLVAPEILAVSCQAGGLTSSPLLNLMNTNKRTNTFLCLSRC